MRPVFMAFVNELAKLSIDYLKSLDDSREAFLCLTVLGAFGMADSAIFFPEAGAAEYSFV